MEDGEEERRRMHNTILDLAGSVRVYVRARPFLKSDGEGAADEVMVWFGLVVVFDAVCTG